MRVRGTSRQARHRIEFLLQSAAFVFFSAAVGLAAAPPISFGVKSTRFWVGQSQVFSFGAESSNEPRTWDTRIEPADAAEILQPATVLAGEKIGFLRLRPLKPGKATLYLGEQSLPVELMADASAGSMALKPEIITPRGGAMVFGELMVGVQLQLPDPKQPTPKVSLRVGADLELSPKRQTLPEEGADRIYAFDLNVDQLPAGPLKLQSCLEDAAGRKTLGEPLYVYVMWPDQSALNAGACVDTIQSPRPERFGVDKVPIVAKATAEAPQGYIQNSSPEPAWCFSEKIPEDGWYQFFVRARGTPAAGSFPSIGLMVDDQDRPKAATRLADRQWQRVAVGSPIFLPAGDHILTARFLNDFQAGKSADRNLHLERYELVRVSPKTTAAADSEMAGADSMMAAAPAMTMMSDGPAMAMTGSGTTPAGDQPLEVTFAQPFDERLITGPVTVRAQARWSKGLPAPRIDLVINDKVEGSQYGADLDFRVPSEVFQSGENRVQLRAVMPNGIASSSPVQRLVRPKIAGAAQGKSNRAFRFSVLDPAWDLSMAQRLEKAKNAPAAEVAAFYSNGESWLRLPEDLSGKFRVRLEARGQEFKGAPIAELFLKTGDRLTPIGQQAVSGSYREFAVGKIELPRGPKQLVVRYANDAMVDAKQDRNWWLKSIRLEEDNEPPATPPAVKVVYAPPTALTSPDGGVDAVVAEGFSLAGIQSAELVVDGQPQRIELATRDGIGRLVFPLLTRGLKPGIHQFQVRVKGRNQLETLSPKVTFRVASAVSGPVEKDRYARAIHLLNRFGYGPDPEELADILLMGELPWLKSRLSGEWDNAGEQVAMAQAAFRFPDSTNRGNVINRALLHLLLTPNPVRSRFVLWTENHFSTWIQKTEPGNKWLEHQRFLELGVAPFSDLLFASATSPAMLVYLDQFRSLKGKLNENYAREIMELHTVGVRGGYSQDDVTNLAGLLTGWTLSSDAGLSGKSDEMVRAFRYEPAANSENARRIFGMQFSESGPLDRLDRARVAIEMLAAHPATADFISRKLAEHYVSVPAPEALVKRLAGCFRRTGGDMRELMVEIARSPEFWKTKDQPKFATPLDYGIRLCRQSGTINPGALGGFLNQSGMGLFDCPTPNGYPEVDSAYADSNALLQRWKFSKVFQEKVSTFLPASLNTDSVAWSPEMGQATLDYVATRLLGRPLGARSNRAALDYVAKAEVSPRERYRLAATFITQLPENNLR